MSDCMQRFYRAAFIIFVLVFSVIGISESSHASESKNQDYNICKANRNETWTVGLIYCDGNISPGYTLFSPISSTTSYLIDEYGREVHRWESPGGHRPGLSAYLLDDGDLLRTANLGNNQPGDFSAGGSAGKIERISWEGELEWSWTYSSQTYRSHHDIEPMPNGNILVIAWEEMSEQEVVQAGKDTSGNSNKAVTSTTLWPDVILEIEPIGTDDYNIVWKWRAWDHLIQDYDSSKDNFGIVEDHPELLDVNYMDAEGGASGGRDWMHCNGIDYNEALDQIAISCKNMNEVYIIDHSTTTQEAAGHIGGDSGMGGDILYRWGNPEAYRAGDENDQVLFAQHDVQWIEQGRENSGDLIVFNNGNGRDSLYSSVDIFTPPLVNGSYVKNVSEAFGPVNTSWSWNIGTEMYAPSISGAERLPNGNTLVTYGTRGTFYEVDLTGEIVWKYISPINTGEEMSQGDSIYTGNGNKVFKVKRYDSNSYAFKDKEITPGDYIEDWVDQCPSEDSIPWDIDGDGCLDDSDLDGITDNEDICNGFNDSIDYDNDLIPDGCDELIDSDFDNIEDSLDLCHGFDDNVDHDNDSIPDGCDDLIDSDNDSISDATDICYGFDDLIDLDNDSIPDGCDDLIDSDNDSISDALDICDGFDDLIDLDNDSIPDDCDSIIDSDDDGVDDNSDICDGGNDSIDSDLDGIPDFCDDNIDLETDLESNNDTKHDDNGNRDLNSFISTNDIVKISLTIAILCSLSYFYVRTRND